MAAKSPVMTVFSSAFPRRAFRLVWTLASLAAGIAAVSAEDARFRPAQVWVAPDGRVGAEGTQEAPVGSLAEAVRKVREWRRTRSTEVSAGAEIILRGGTHRLTDPVVFRPEDSGTEEAPTVVRAAEGESPTLSGGMVLKNWRRADVWPERLPAQARGRVWVTDVPRTHGRPLEFRQLWVNDRKAVRARRPDGDDMFRLVAWNKEAQEAEIPSPALAGVRDVREAELVIHQMWEIAVLRLRTATGDGGSAWVTFEAPEGPIQFEHPWPPPIVDTANPGRNSAFFVVNAPEFLTVPGEWWLDRANERVYYWPLPDETLASSEVVVPILESLIEIAGSEDHPVRHLTFEDLRFAHATWLRPSMLGHVPHQATMYMTEAYRLRPPGTPDWRSLDNQAWVGRPPALVAVRGGERLTWRNCIFAHGAMAGLDLERAVRDTLVTRSVFRDLGGNGLQAGFYGDASGEVHLPYNPRDARSVVARVEISDSTFDDTANEDWGGVALSVGFAREITIAHNDIINTSYSGISVGWGWTRTPNAMARNVVEGNRIRRFGTRNADTGGIYLLGAQPGSRVERNAIDTPQFSPWVHDPNHWGYVYLDEGSSYTLVRDNWSPTEKVIANANGPGNEWGRNGPAVDESVRSSAGPR